MNKHISSEGQLAFMVKAGSADLKQEVTKNKNSVFTSTANESRYNS